MTFIFDRGPSFAMLDSHSKYSTRQVVTLIPSIWNQQILTKTGRSDKNTISILSEAAYWYKKMILKAKDANNITLNTKSKINSWQTSYRYLQEKFNISTETIRRCFIKLEKLGVLTRELKTVQNCGQLYHNCLFIKLKLDHPLLDVFNLHSESVKPNFSATVSQKVFFISKNVDTPPKIVGDIYKNKEKKDIDNLDSFSLEKKLLKIEKSKLSEFLNLKMDKEKLQILGTSAAVESTKQDQQVRAHTSSGVIKLSEIGLFSEEEAKLLQAKSGRDFNLNFMNQLLLKFQRIKSSYSFPSKFVFLNYFAKVLKHEKHDSVQTSNNDFRLKCNIPADGIDVIGEEIARNRRKDQYLQNIESSCDNSHEAQLRRKIAGGFESNIAYKLLTNLHNSQELNPDEIRLEFWQEIKELNNRQTKEKLLQVVQSVYGQRINNVKIELGRMSNNQSHAISDDIENRNSNFENYNPGIDKNSLWGMVRKGLLEHYNIHIDKHWFSKLIAVEDSERKQLSLKAPNNFVRDWINTNFYDQMKRLGNSYGIMIEELI